MKKLLFYLFFISSSFGGAGQILKKRIPDRLVVFTFDDAAATHYSFVAPLLKKYGFGATFFVCEFPPDYGDTTKYMTWAQIRQLDKMGFEVANHTHTHAHVTKLNKDQLSVQLSYIENKCDSLKIDKPVTFAYPGYSINEAAFISLKEKGYLLARAGGSRPYDPLNDHPYLIPSWATLANNKQQILEALQQAQAGKIVVLTVHGVPDKAHPWVTTPPELFKEYLQYLHDNHYKVIALRDLLSYINVEEAQKNIKPDFQKPIRN